MWTPEQVLALAPDASSIRSGQDLANERKWVSLGCNDTAVWGECQGSGKNPYQTQIDLSEPAFKCSCPSRKFPCKHSLGLFLLYAQRSKSMTQGAPPDWAAEWLASRAKRAEKQAVKAEEREKKEVDPAAQAKRAANREAKVDAGLKDLELWLCDLIRSGLAAAQVQPYSFWENMAARMVDSQAPGVARAVSNMGEIANSGEGWQERLLRRISRLYLLLEAYKRIDTLPEPLQSDIRSLIGWTQDQDQLLRQDGLRDTWFVTGQRVYDDDRLRVQRTWLLGVKSARQALILNFSHMSQPMIDSGLAPGIYFDGELVFFPGAYPLRALIKTRSAAPAPPTQIPVIPTIDSALQQYSDALARNPWLFEIPIILGNVTPLRQNDRWLVRDASGDTLPITLNYGFCWHMLSISGGHPVAIFGEYDGEYLTPMSIMSKSGYFHLSAGGEQ